MVVCWNKSTWIDIITNLLLVESFLYGSYAQTDKVVNCDQPRNVTLSCPDEPPGHNYNYQWHYPGPNGGSEVIKQSGRYYFEGNQRKNLSIISFSRQDVHKGYFCSGKKPEARTFQIKCACNVMITAGSEKYVIKPWGSVEMNCSIAGLNLNTWTQQKQGRTAIFEWLRSGRNLGEIRYDSQGIRRRSNNWIKITEQDGLHIKNVEERHVGKYQCKLTLTGHEDCTTPIGAEMELQVLPNRPTVASTPKKETWNVKDSVTLICYYQTSSSSLIYQWQHKPVDRQFQNITGNGESLELRPKPKESRIVIKSIGMKHAGEYRCRLKNNFGFSDWNYYNLNVSTTDTSGSGGFTKSTPSSGHVTKSTSVSGGVTKGTSGSESAIPTWLIVVPIVGFIMISVIITIVCCICRKKKDKDSSNVVFRKTKEEYQQVPHDIPIMDSTNKDELNTYAEIKPTAVQTKPSENSHHQTELGTCVKLNINGDKRLPENTVIYDEPVKNDTKKQEPTDVYAQAWRVPKRDQEGALDKDKMVRNLSEQTYGNIGDNETCEKGEGNISSEPSRIASEDGIMYVNPKHLDFDKQGGTLPIKVSETTEYGEIIPQK